MPQHKRGPWSQSEDNYLLQLVQMHGASNWVRISQAIQTRSPKQCRERFHQNLKPTLNHEPITSEEGMLIEQMVNDMGKRWAEIARRLRGRSDNAVKNWWNGGMNRRRRNNNPRRVTALELRVPQQQQPQQQPPHPQPRQHPSAMAQTHILPHTQQQPLPTDFPPPPPAVPQQYFQMPGPMYHQGHPAMPNPIRVPSGGAGPAYRTQNGIMMETPLPSPSAYSQMSAEGAPPSLISDSSSISTRSPHSGTSPIELPPLSGSRSERRQSSAPMLTLGVPGSFVSDDFPPQQIALQTRYSMDDVAKQAQHQHHQQQHNQAMRHASMDQDGIYPQQQQQMHPQQPYLQPNGAQQNFMHPQQRMLPQQQQQQQQHEHQMARQHSGMHQQPYLVPHQQQQQHHPQQHHQVQHPHQQQKNQMYQQQPPPPPTHLLPSQPVQLPSIANLSPPGSSNGLGIHNGNGGEVVDASSLVIDPEIAAAAAAAARETPGSMGMPSSPDGSPKDKMSLSNLTT